MTRKRRASGAIAKHSSALPLSKRSRTTKALPKADEAIALCIINGLIEEEDGPVYMDQLEEKKEAPKSIDGRLQNVLGFINSFESKFKGDGCRVCGKSDEVETFSIQTRASDEPATEIFLCKRCEVRWKT